MRTIYHLAVRQYFCRLSIEKQLSFGLNWITIRETDVYHYHYTDHTFADRDHLFPGHLATEHGAAAAGADKGKDQRG